jgi:hypothetical protein
MPSLLSLLLLLLWLTVAAASNFALPCHGSRCCFCLSNRLLRLISLLDCDALQTMESPRETHSTCGISG